VREERGHYDDGATERWIGDWRL